MYYYNYDYGSDTESNFETDSDSDINSRIVNEAQYSFDDDLHPTIDEIVTSNIPYFHIIRNMGKENLVIIIEAKK